MINLVLIRHLDPGTSIGAPPIDFNANSGNWTEVIGCNDTEGDVQYTVVVRRGFA